MSGNLTIKETTKPIRFNAQMSEEGGMKVATCDIQLDRSDFDVRWLVPAVSSIT
ncbi:MAG: YceI family protein [Saprospiraceae bacterium]